MGEEGGDAGAVLNASDEVSVAAFLAGEIGFQDIHRVNRSVLDRRSPRSGGLEELLRADADARRAARAEVETIAGIASS